MSTSNSHLRVVLPIAGTVHWSPSGEALGVWDDDLAIKPKVLLDDGTIRDLTKAEARFYQHTGRPAYD